MHITLQQKNQMDRGAMKTNHSKYTDSHRQQQENLKFAQDRIQLLDTIRQMIDIELDRRSHDCSNCEQEQADRLSNTLNEAHPENPPPLHGQGYGEPVPRLTLWRRIITFFSRCLC